MKDNLLYVNHILDNIEKIESFSKNYTKSDFLKDELVQYAVIRAIEVIGEAVKNMSLSIKNKHSEIAWKDISGTRDILIHHYFEFPYLLMYKCYLQSIHHY